MLDEASAVCARSFRFTAVAVRFPRMTSSPEASGLKLELQPREGNLLAHREVSRYSASNNPRFRKYLSVDHYEMRFSDNIHVLPIMLAALRAQAPLVYDKHAKHAKRCQFMADKQVCNCHVYMLRAE